MPDCLVLVINLKRSPERRRHIESELRKVGITDYAMVEAIDGQDLDADVISRYQQHILEVTDIKKYPRLHCYKMSRQLAKQMNTSIPICNPITPNELACTLSHLKCCEHLLKSTAQAALVLEDDGVLNPDLPKVIQRIDCFAAHWKVIHIAHGAFAMLPVFTNHYTRHQPLVGYTMGQACGYNNHASGYFISRAGATYWRHTRNLLGKHYPNIEAFCTALPTISDPIPLTKVLMQPWDNHLFGDKLDRHVYNFHYIRPPLVTTAQPFIEYSSIRGEQPLKTPTLPSNKLLRFLFQFLFFRVMRRVISLLIGQISLKEFYTRANKYRDPGMFYLTATLASFHRPKRPK